MRQGDNVHLVARQGSVLDIAAAEDVCFAIDNADTVASEGEWVGDPT